jgi:Uma2 family endonuclease
MTALLLTPKVLNPVKFTVEQYHLMYEAGIFGDGGGTHTEGNRYELINGEIIVMSPIGRKHGAYINRLVAAFTQKFGDRIVLSVQNSILLANKSQPQPDLAILKYRDDFYEEALPIPADILLIIEVADSSLEYDRDVKAPLYAAAGIPEMWLFDVNTKSITGFTQPSDLGYKQINRYSQGDRLSILAFDDVVFEWQELL